MGMGSFSKMGNRKWGNFENYDFENGLVF